VNGLAKGFQGGAFDGRYVYLVPYFNGVSNSGTIARYDTKADFGTPSSWFTFDITSINPAAKGFVRAAFDGRYLYLVPHHNGAAYHGLTARYDTQGGFDAPTSWTTFDMSTVNAGSKGFWGAVFDGRYVYYSPYYNNTAHHGLVTRYDTQAVGGFSAPASWSTFNMQSVNMHLVGFLGAQFDGRYVYFAQYYDGAAQPPGYYGWIARYDTQADFASGSSWQSFNALSINTGAGGFAGTAFDGRYIYFVPNYNGTTASGIMARYDTMGAGFGVGASWAVFDTGSVNASAKGFNGAGFDGQNLYLIPGGSIVARFTTKTPSWLPRAWNRSFD
jgi:hypothetical protein